VAGTTKVQVRIFSFSEASELLRTVLARQSNQKVASTRSLWHLRKFLRVMEGVILEVNVNHTDAQRGRGHKFLI